MKMLESSVRVDGSVLLPEEVRTSFGLKAGDAVEFKRTAGGFELKPRNSRVDEFFGIARLGVPPLSDEELEQLIDEAVAEEFEERFDRGIR